MIKSHSFSPKAESKIVENSSPVRIEKVPSFGDINLLSPMPSKRARFNSGQK